MIRATFLLLLVLASTDYSRTKCDCAHFPWRPKECVRPCEKRFVADEIRRNDEAIVLGKLATQRASNPDVKSFGQHVVDERSTMKYKFQSLAMDLRLSNLPDGEAIHQRLLDKFKSYSGASFDSNYMSFETTEFKKEFSLLQHVSRADEVSKDVKAVAAETLPSVKSQLESAASLSSKLR